ncbi:leucine-rich repeat protein, partial [Tanacetum coccineum]
MKSLQAIIPLSSSSCISFLFYGLSIVCLTSATVSASYGGNETDYHALLSFKSMITHDPYKVLTSWNHSIHFCDWSGGIPPFLGNITSIERFSAAGNPFGGGIPDTLGPWKSLTGLGIGGCNLYGRIPHSIFNLSLLVN